VTLLLVPVIYSIFVYDLKLVKWEMKPQHQESATTQNQYCLDLRGKPAAQHFAKNAKCAPVPRCGKRGKRMRLAFS